LQFTLEKSTNTQQFLDVDIKINEHGVDIWAWRKPTCTSLFLNFNADCPLRRKSGLITCMLRQAKVICSNDNLFLLK